MLSYTNLRSCLTQSQTIGSSRLVLFTLIGGSSPVSLLKSLTAFHPPESLYLEELGTNLWLLAFKTHEHFCISLRYVALKSWMLFFPCLTAHSLLSEIIEIISNSSCKLLGWGQGMSIFNTSLTCWIYCHKIDGHQLRCSFKKCLDQFKQVGSISVTIAPAMKAGWKLHIQRQYRALKTTSLRQASCPPALWKHLVDH